MTNRLMNKLMNKLTNRQVQTSIMTTDSTHPSLQTLATTSTLVSTHASAAPSLQASLHYADLHYGGDLVLHTASSGSVGHLETLYLHLVEDGHFGIGEVRINIAYLNGIAAETVKQDARRMLDAINWDLGSQRLLDSRAAWLSAYSAPIRMLVDSALLDLCARRAGVSVATLFGSGAAPVNEVTSTADSARLAANGASPSSASFTHAAVASWPSNQTLFWQPDERMLARAGAYLARGFHDLKLRVGIADFDDDLRRIDLLRTHFGDSVVLSVDANGQWSTTDALPRLQALAERGIDYVEQPIAAGDWDALTRLAEVSPVTIMLDESLQSQPDIDRLCALSGAPIAAHLKLVKLGGIAATITAARRLTQAGVPLMIGQMNEGAAATAAALQVCLATRPRWAELYGADGLRDDPVTGLQYGHGTVELTTSLEATRGLGVTFNHPIPSI